MKKEDFYNKIKRLVYRKFNELEVAERNDGNILYLRYKNEEYAQIVIEKKSDKIFYSYKVILKIHKITQLKKVDFEILLGRWVEDTFKIKVEHIQPTLRKFQFRIPLK